MEHKILSWNIRGLGKDNKLVAIRNAIRKNNPNIVRIQETKREIVDDALIRSLWGSNRCTYVYLASEGASGGIIVMWKEGVVQMEDHLLGAFTIIKFRNLTDDFVWVFTVVYGTSDAGYYSQFWQELRDIRLIFDEPWMLGGDFNATLSADERNRPGGGLANRKSFRSFVNRYSLIDLPLSGGRFTWTNSQQPPLLIRLDRFLLSPEFNSHCPAPIQMRLNRPISDHAQIMLCCNSGDKVKSPFRLDNFILSHPDFLGNLKIWWDILIFTETNFGNLKSQIDNLELSIDVLDNLEEISGLTDDDVVAKEQAKLQHTSLSLSLARKLSQRAKERWDKDG
ncbi:uncharacterized protein LOC113360212 [Papaver somniferum]|uniref:uncharacterized protein LOC113360212 n=1 Tax=Papaver somniferum TaxID=3469 RepID=UPI000E703270|nr:uncharacterized protein LOC113360212 [Papaver somniferum]